MNNNIKKEEENNTKFTIFINALAQQAIMAMGLMPWPDTGKILIKIEIAKEMINIIEMLKEKTKNNLNSLEENTINNIIYELKLNFINKNKI